MNIPREFIELLLAKIDIVDVINTQIPLRKKSGSNFFARCPFHTEKSASFSVSQTKQFYYCFGCGAHGNAIDFLIQHERLSFPEAIETLARSVSMEVPHSGTTTKKDETLPALFERLTQVSAYYYEQMRLSSRAIDYLKSRGIKGNIAQQFSLGYAPPGWNHLLDHFGKTEAAKKQLLDVGLIIHKQEGGYYDRFRDRILYPIYDYRGRIIGFGGRIIDQGEPKYLNSPETPLFQKGHELYGLYQALKINRHLERVLIVEGYMDVIALFQHGISYAVATLGTATSSHHLQRLFRYTADIIFCFDGDDAGRTAAWRALQVALPLMQDNVQIRFLFLPDGEDPDSLIRKESKAQFEERIANSASLSTFFFQRLGTQCDMNTMEGRARFAKLALNHIKQVPSGFFQSLLLEALSKRARIDLVQLKQQIKTEPVATTAVPPPADITMPAPLRRAMALLIQHPHLVSFLTEPLPKSDLPGSHFLAALIEIIQRNPNITTGALIEYWRGHQDESVMATLANWQQMTPDEGVHNEFLGAIRQLLLLNLDEEIARLLAKASQETLASDEKQALSNLIARKKGLSHASP